MYLKVGFAPEVDEARVRAVREAVGDGPRIRIDANAAWSPALALRHARSGSHASASSTPSSPSRRATRPSWRACARARRCRSWRTSRASRSRAARGASAHGGADALQLDPRFDAGIAGARTAAQVAEAAGLPVVTHTFGETGVGTALMLQLHAAHRNFVLDNQTYYPNLTDDVIARRPARVRRPVPGGADGARAWASISTASACAHWAAYHEREVAGRGAAGARRPLLRPRLPDPAAHLAGAAQSRV